MGGACGNKAQSPQRASGDLQAASKPPSGPSSSQVTPRVHLQIRGAASKSEVGVGLCLCLHLHLHLHMWTCTSTNPRLKKNTFNPTTAFHSSALSLQGSPSPSAHPPPSLSLPLSLSTARILSCTLLVRRLLLVQRLSSANITSTYFPIPHRHSPITSSSEQDQKPTPCSEQCTESALGQLAARPRRQLLSLALLCSAPRRTAPSTAEGDKPLPIKGDCPAAKLPGPARKLAATSMYGCPEFPGPLCTISPFLSPIRPFFDGGSAPANHQRRQCSCALLGSLVSLVCLVVTPTRSSSHSAYRDREGHNADPGQAVLPSARPSVKHQAPTKAVI